MSQKPEDGCFESAFGHHVHFEDYGTGKTVLLVHGWAMHSGIWGDFAKQLAERFRVISVDLPGHGRSDAVQPYNLQKIGDALLQAVPDEPSCWMGWSLGANVALDIGRRYPNRVDSLILVAGNPRFVLDAEWPGMPIKVLEAFAENLDYSSQLTLQRFLGLQVRGLPNSRTIVSRMKAVLSECDVPDEQVLKAGLEILKNSDLRPALKQIQKPVLLALGEKDTLVPVATGKAVQKWVPEAKVHVIEGAGHVPLITHRQELIKIISNFINDDERCI